MLEWKAERRVAQETSAAPFIPSADDIASDIDYEIEEVNYEGGQVYGEDTEGSDDLPPDQDQSDEEEERTGFMLAVALKRTVMKFQKMIQQRMKQTMTPKSKMTCLTIIKT